MSATVDQPRRLDLKTDRRTLIALERGWSSRSGWPTRSR